MTVIAGGGTSPPSSNQPADRVSFTFINALAADRAGNVFFVHSTTFGAARVFKVDASGTLTELNTQGLPSTAFTCMTFDPAGNLFLFLKKEMFCPGENHEKRYPGPP